MRKSSYIVLFILALVLSAAWLRQARDEPVVESAEHHVARQVANSTQERQLENSADSLDLSRAESPAREALEPDCDTADLASLGRSHPIVIDVYERFSPILVQGAALEAYRHQSHKEIHELAQSGDSMAMAMLGALEYLKVNPKGDTHVVDLLNTGDLFLGTYVPPERQSASDIDALDRAAYWFEEAALHGRLSAIGLYAQVLSQRFGGAQELGWITAEQIEQNPNLPNLAHPMNVYIAVLFNLEPELRFSRSGAEEWAPDNPDLQSIIDEQTRLFIAAQEERGLKNIRLAPSRYTNAQIREALCTSTKP